MIRIKCEKCEAGNLSNARYCCECGYELPKPVLKETINTNISSTRPKKDFRTRNIVFIVILGITMNVGLSLLIRFSVQKVLSDPPAFMHEIIMMYAADELNKKCPATIDSETRLDSAEFLPSENIFQYNYTLVNLEKEAIDTLEFKEILSPNIINNARTSPQMKLQRKYQTTLNYYYKDKNGEYACIISITPDQFE